MNDLVPEVPQAAAVLETMQGGEGGRTVICFRFGNMFCCLTNNSNKTYSGSEPGAAGVHRTMRCDLAVVVRNMKHNLCYSFLELLAQSTMQTLD